MLGSGGSLVLGSGGIIVLGGDVELGGDVADIELGGDVVSRRLVGCRGSLVCIWDQGGHPDWTAPDQTLHRGSQMVQSAWE